MRPLHSSAFRKLFLVISVGALFLYASFSTSDHETVEISHQQIVQPTTNRPESKNLKYILLWTPDKCIDCAPFESLGKDQYPFRRINCEFQNCHLTSNKSLLSDVTKYDAIIFNGRPVSRRKLIELPDRRSQEQMYVFLQLESADRFPVCHPIYDGFFNRTFTYRLKSDFTWPYFVVKNESGEVIGPKQKMDWVKFENMDGVDEEFGQMLRSKKKMAAWFVSNCRSRNNREKFVENLQKELQRHNHTIDIYGKCGPLKCPRQKSGVCDEYVQRDYYFYLSLENSFSEDYVTEKLLTPLLNSAVPIVYGAADYNRFLPPGSYLNGRLLGPAKLAVAMLGLMQNSTLYEAMFRWRRYYSYSPTWPAPLCQLCRHLNQNQHHVKEYPKFREWWFPNYNKRC